MSQNIAPYSSSTMINIPIRNLYKIQNQIYTKGPFGFIYSNMKRANIIAQVLRYINKMYDEYSTITPSRDISIEKDTVVFINDTLKENNGWYPRQEVGFFLPLKKNLTYDKNKINEASIDKITFIYKGSKTTMYDILKSYIDEIINYYRNDKQPYYPSNIEYIINNFLYYSSNKREEKEKVNNAAKNIVNNVMMQVIPQAPTNFP